MKRKLNNFFALDALYTDTFKNHGVNVRSVDKISSGYDNFKEFKDNIKAPIQIPLVTLSANLRAIIGCIENTAYLMVNVVAMDFSDAYNNVISILNDVSSILYQTLRAVFDIVLSLIELPVRSMITLKDWIEAPKENIAENSAPLEFTELPTQVNP